MKIKAFRREIQKFGDWKIPTIWPAGRDPIPDPPSWRSLKSERKTEKTSK